MATALLGGLLAVGRPAVAQADTYQPSRYLPVIPISTPVPTCSSVFSVGSSCPAPTPAQADLTVTQGPPNANGHDQFIVANTGQGGVGPFRIAVLAGAQSYSINVAGLAAGGHIKYQLPDLACGQAVAILVDADNQVQETNESNNAIGFSASCPLDGGSNGGSQGFPASG